MKTLDKLSVRDVDFTGKTALVRVDYNVPFVPGSIEISDNSRILASLPTVKYLQDNGSKVVLCSHLGRPNGEVVEEMSLRPVSTLLAKMLNGHIDEVYDCMNSETMAVVRELGPGEVILLENVRFHRGEEENDTKFATKLAGFADIFVNDAFGTAHRAHASTVGVASYLPGVAGLLMERELTMLGTILGHVKRPFAAVFGGSKVSDKMGILQRLAPELDALIVGGGMAATFLKASGLNVGDSAVEDQWLPKASELMARFPIQLPVDVVVGRDFSDTTEHTTVRVDEIPANWRIMDIGPSAIEEFKAVLRSVSTVVWNGSMGVAEWPKFSNGTRQIATAIASLTDAITVLGGGSTAESVRSYGLTDRMTHVSTGGGASLEFLEGRELPGVAALMDKHNKSG